MVVRASPPASTNSLSGRRILLTGINYWPEETGNAPYTTGLAEHLAARGAQVTVVTGMPYYPAWQVWDGYRGKLRLRETIQGVDVRRYRHYVPGRQTAIRRALFEATFLFNALLTAGIPRPDVVVGVVPSLSGGALAAAAAWRYRVPFGLIFQDLVGQSAAQSGISGGGRVAGATRLIEGWLVRSARGVAIVSESFRAYLHGLGVAGERIQHVPNWSHIAPPTQPRATTRERLGWPPETQVVLHAGAMGLKQGLDNVVAAAWLAAETQAPVRFVLMGDGNQRARLEHLAHGCPTITFLEPRPADDFSNVLAAADVLLVNERSSVVDMSLPSKLTSYFVAGRPVVAAVVPRGATAREVTRSGAGLVVPADQPAALLSALDRLRIDPALAAGLGASGPVYAAQHLGADASLARAEAFVGSIGADGLAVARPVWDCA